MPVELTCQAASGRPYAGALRADALALLGILALEHYELSLMLVSDSGIRRLNRKFRGKDQAADVLSFPQLGNARELERSPTASSPDEPPLALGDIVISIDTARRQACELGHGAAARIRTLLIHGMLHLLGYDHERSMTEARRMFTREHELAALMSDAGGRRPRSRRSKAQAAPNETVTTRTDEISDLRWSPAAMPERSAKAVKKPSARRKPKIKAAARTLSPRAKRTAPL